MEKILITGGSGFIGTNLIEAVKDEFEILNIDIEKPKIPEHSKYWKKTDINDFDALRYEMMLFEPDYVLHLAARCDLKGQTVDDYKTNSLGTQNVLQIAKEVGTVKKIILTSSMLVCYPGYKPKDEQDYSPKTAYGESKVLTEQAAWQAELDCDWAIVRPTSIWGPWFGEPYYDFFKMIMNKRYIHIGKNDSLMTYGFVGNVVREYLGILRADTRESAKVFYLGDYEPLNVEKWADYVADEVNIKIPTCPRWLIDTAAKIGDVLAAMGISFPLTSFRLGNMTTDNVFDLSNTREVCGSEGFTDIQTGVKKTVEWMLKK